MNLCIDIGNTRSKAALFRWSAPGEPVDTTVVELFAFEDVFPSVAELKNILDHYPIKGSMISSVRHHPSEIEDFLRERTFFLVLTQDTAVPIGNAYATPHTLGRDRLAGAVGGAKLFPGEHTLVIDAGTCITYDFTDEHDVYQGGGISPGMRIKFEALHTFTDKLPLVEYDLKKEVPLVGNDTHSSIRSGVIQGTIAELAAIIDAYRAKFQPLKVLLTGGDASFFESQLKNKTFVRPYLVMEGLHHILLYHDAKRRID